MNRPNIESIRARAEQYQDPCAVEGDLCATMAAAATSYRWDIPTLLDYVKELETAARRGHIKPTHGSCCICQRCGRDYDDCRCDLDDTVDENEKLKAKNAELEAGLRPFAECAGDWENYSLDYRLILVAAGEQDCDITVANLRRVTELVEKESE